MVYIKAISVVLIINAIFVTLGVLTISITGVDILGVFLMLCGVSIAAIKGSKFLEKMKNSCWHVIYSMVYLIYRKGDDLNGKLFT